MIFLFSIVQVPFFKFHYAFSISYMVYLDDCGCVLPDLT